MVIRIKPLNQKIMRDIWNIKGQCIAISFVLACGVSLMIATFGTVFTLDNSLEAFYDRTRFGDIFADAKRAPNILIKEIEKIPGVAIAETRISGWANLDLENMEEAANAQLLSFPERGVPLLNGLVVIDGEYPNAKRPKEIMISESFANAHNLKIGDKLNAILTGNKRGLRITALVLSPEYIYALGPGSLMPDDKRFGVVWMGRKALEAAFDMEGAFSNLSIILQKGASEKEVIQRVDNYLEIYGGLGAHNRDEVVSHFFLKNELIQLKASGSAIPPVFLIVAAFLLHLVVSRIITMEREQIGLLKAFGYSDNAIGWLYFKLIIIIVSLGLLFGILMGVWMGNGMINMYSTYFKFPLIKFELDSNIFLASAFISFTAGFLGGFSAVRKAVKLAPAVAMAPAVPVSYSEGIYARVFKTFSLSQPTRMIFRHVIRFPLRATFTILGIAFSISLMIMSLFFIDSVEEAIDIHFFQSERQTMTVFFLEPISANVELEIKKLPGVLKTQPIRNVTAILSKKNLEKRTNIQGITLNPDLSRLLDRDQNSVNPPLGGIALSTHIARKLEAGLGDNIRVKILNESRPDVSLPIVQLIEEQMGFGAYMHINALNKLMKESKTVSAVHLLIDSKYSNELYSILKNTPLVAGIVQQDATLEEFQKTMDNTMYIFIGFYVGLASLISFGVVYNTSRIVLSERSRALASLRVLGFSQAETAYILLGELLILALAALPVGCILGYVMAYAMSPMLSTDLYNFPLVIQNATYGISMSIVTLAVILCGINAGSKVFKLDIISNLKMHE